jgi:hypothetical protein
MKNETDLNEALLYFIDFIYAVVFGFIVQQSFDGIINSAAFPSWHAVLILALAAGISYFLIWDWVLGRILTLSIPYRSYTRFFCELSIAAFAYGTVSAAMKEAIIFLVHFALVLLFGALWAWRTAAHVKNTRDAQEICVIQRLQFTGFGIILVFFLWWKYMVKAQVTKILITETLVLIWILILAYEMVVPRAPGVIAGPGVPFIPRSDVRKLRRRMFGFIK